jgi:hypothetical protein
MTSVVSVNGTVLDESLSAFEVVTGSLGGEDERTVFLAEKIDDALMQANRYHEVDETLQQVWIKSIKYLCDVAFYRE